MEKKIWLNEKEIENLLNGDLQWKDILDDRTNAEISVQIREQLFEPHMENQGVNVGWLLLLMIFIILGFWIYFVFYV